MFRMISAGRSLGGLVDHPPGGPRRVGIGADPNGVTTGAEHGDVSRARLQATIQLAQFFHQVSRGPL